MVIRKFGIVKAITLLSRVYLDFDRRRTPRLIPLWAVCRIVGVRPLWIRSDRTRKGWHVVIALRDKLAPAELVALQACMGSDRRRETLNLLRVIGMRRSPIHSPFWQSRWNLLYASKLTAPPARHRSDRSTTPRRAARV